MPMTKEFPAQRVRDAVLAHIKEGGGRYQLWQTQDAVAKAMGQPDSWRSGGSDENGKRTTFGVQLARRFEGQVYRYLNELSMGATPMLIKVSKGETGPERTYAGEPVWYTPQAYAAAQDHADAVAKAKAHTRGRWERVWDVAVANGYSPLHGGSPYEAEKAYGEPVNLSVDDFEKLLGMN